MDETLPPMESEDELELSFRETIMLPNGAPPNPKTESKNPAPETDQPKPTEDKIPGFRILDEIGRGAFGVVYRAEDVHLNRLVAIKLPLLGDDKLAERYVQEARNAAKVDTHGVVPVYQVGTTQNGQPFVVQKLIDGETLRAILRGPDRLPVSRATETIFKIATAISGAHEMGLVHRDLKPANILIDQQDEPWVADFGLAVLEEDQRALRGEIAGTPAYMAPEQFTERADWLDGRADIWAIGIILYETLTGRVPFESDDLEDIQDQIQNRSPRPISQRLVGAPQELDQIFNRCCAKQVGDRYPNAKELANDLERILQDPILSQLDTTVRSRLSSAGTWRTAQRPPEMSGASTVNLRSLFRKAGDSPHTNGLGIRPWILPVAGLLALLAIGGVLIWPYLSQTSHAPETAKNLTPHANNTLPARESGIPRSHGDGSIVQRLRVSKTGQGTHTSISEALQAATSGCEIVLAPGIYRESLQIEQDVQLIGEGARDEITIFGNQAAALKISGGSRVKLTNVTIETGGNNVNTIEVIDGNLQISGCRLRTAGYDCIKVHPNAELIAKDCSFRSAAHPAIVAHQAESLQIDQCSFEFELPNLGIRRDQPIAGIQLSGGGGSIRGCSFNSIDRVGKGISCRSTTAKLTIADCKFSALLHAVELFDVPDVDMISLNVISGSQLGIYAENSQGSIQDIDVKGCDYGFTLLKQSHFSTINGKFENNARVGIWLQDSHLDLESCFINDNQTVGIVVDQQNADLGVKAGNCSIQSNEIGALLVSGTINLESGLISQNRGAGIAVLDYESLPAELKQRRKADTNPERNLVARRTTLNGKTGGPAILFNAPGSFTLEDCPYVDLPNHNKPALGGELTTEIHGNTTLVVGYQTNRTSE